MIVECEGCRKKYRIAEAMAGKRLRCKACGHPILVPSAQPAREKAAPVTIGIRQDEDPFEAAARAAEQGGDEDERNYGTPIALAPPPVPPASSAHPQPAPAAAPSRGADDPESLRSFRARLGDKRRALVAFGQARARRYASNRMTASCCNCGKEGEVPAYQMRWSAQIGGGPTLHWSSFILIFVGYVVWSRAPVETTEFNTYHRICGRCRMSYLFAGAVRGLIALISIVGILASLVMMSVSRHDYTHFNPRTHRPGFPTLEYPYRIYGIVLMLLCIAGLVYPFLLKRHFLKDVAPSPFRRVKSSRI